MKTDFNYKLLISLRKTLYHIITTLNHSKKCDKTIKLIGCSIVFYKEYIESLFLPNMSWKNHGLGKGKWHLDHILPCELFDFTDPRQQFICFNYKNMQPLWADNNINQKSDFLPDGRRARNLSKEEKLEYLMFLGHKL